MLNRNLFLAVLIAILTQYDILAYQPPRVDNPELRSLVDLALIGSVAREVGIKDEQVKALKEVAKTSASLQNLDSRIRITAVENEVGRPIRPGDILTRVEPISQATVLPILSNVQWHRLKQISSQRNIQQSGFREAIVNGQLGSELELDLQQKEVLNARLKRLEDEAASNIARVLHELQLSILDELPLEKRAKAGLILGAPFYVEKFRGLDLNEARP